jgi:hypothetical protein
MVPVDQADRHGDYGAFSGAIATVPGCCHTINDSGEIVGFALSANGDTRALIWHGTEPKGLNGTGLQRRGLGTGEWQGAVFRRWFRGERRGRRAIYGDSTILALGIWNSDK